jgi:hypothetical protein
LPNLALGSALSALTTGTDNTALGQYALDVITSGVSNTAVGNRAGLSLLGGSTNTIIGAEAGLSATSATGSTFVGYRAGNLVSTGNFNTAIGLDSMQFATSGAANAGSNTAIGHESLNVLTTGVNNTAVGASAGTALLTGGSNIALGFDAASNYTGSESSNIIIGNLGTLAESNTIRIGTAGSGLAQQNRCFIAGIDGVNVGSTATVVTESGTQLGTAVLTAGANITITPGANTITIAANATSVVSNYVTVLFAASPYTALSTDYYISANVTGGAISILLPNAPTTGRVFVVKDKVGLAANE